MATTATNHWKLGLFVLVAVGAMLGTLFWLGARRFRREAFPAISYFDESVQGLDVGSPVKFRGVTVGTVSDITIGPDHRHVQVTANMYVDALVRLGLRTGAPKSGEEFIAPNLRVQLASAGITGVRFIQTDDRLAADLGAEDGSFNRALQELRTAATRVDKAIDAAKFGATTASIRDTSASVGQAAAGLSDAREELQASLVALREALESVRTLADSLERDPSVLLRGPRGDGAVPARR
ncbi:MAG: MCE family protein [Deltaproteobacteria bacterium]|nr:MAG: MCE family protein [Deltaproteobacteria bacterium]